MSSETDLVNLLSTERNPKKRISRAEINELPLYAYAGPICLVSNPDAEREAVKVLKDQSVIGFDTETRPSFLKGKVYNPSLIQMATRDEIFLFHIKAYPLSQGLASILSDSAILKTGVAISDDMRSLALIRPFKAAGIIDLGDIAREQKIAQHGLRGLAALLLGVRISKTEQCSNWGRQNLTDKQIRYAATDAWISLAIYKKMKVLGLVKIGQSEE